MYTFLRAQQVNGISIESMYERFRGDMTKKVKLLVKPELNDENLIQALDSKVTLMAAYTMNVCKMTKCELNDFD